MRRVLIALTIAAALYPTALRAQRWVNVLDYDCTAGALNQCLVDIEADERNAIPYLKFIQVGTNRTCPPGSAKPRPTEGGVPRPENIQMTGADCVMTDWKALCHWYANYRTPQCKITVPRSAVQRGEYEPVEKPGRR